MSDKASSNDRDTGASAEEALREAKIYAESIVETLHEPLLVLTPDLCVKSVNPAFYEGFGVEPDATIGRKIYDLGNGQWDIPELRTLLEDVLPDSKVFNDFEVTHTFEDLGERVMLLNARRLDHVQLILLGIRDITEKKKDVEALRDAKIYAESIVETLHEPLLVLTPDLHVKSVNQAFYDHFEVERKTTIGRKIYDLGNGQWNIPQLRTLLEDVLPDSKVFNDYEVRHTFEDLGERVMLLNARRLDHVQLILLGIRDITERKQSEEALRASEERLRRVIESARDYAILTTDLEGRITSWSPGAEAVFGWREDEIVGELVDCMFTPADREAGAPQRERQQSGREGHAPDVRWHLRKDGSWVFIDGAIWPLEDGASEAVGFLKIGQDVTERREMEEALRESEERLRAIADLVPDLLWRANPDGERTWGNRRWMEYTDQTLDEAAGYGWIRAIHPDDREAAMAKYKTAIESGEPYRDELRLCRGDGAHRWFLAGAVAVRDDDGNITQWFGSYTDVHDQRTLMETLEQRVDERTREVRHLASTLTMAEQEERRRIARILHDDLQQLLFGLHLRLEFLSQDMAGLQVERLEKEFADARDWVGEAIETTRQLSVDLSPPILKNEGLPEALHWLSRQMLEKHHLRVDFSFDPNVRIPDDDLRALLFQAVRELLFNVVKHAGVREAHVRMTRAGERVVIEVIDDGRGFDVAAASREAGGVVGIGLFSVNERLRLIGGALHIESNPGKGTRVSITTPATTDH